MRSRKKKEKAVYFLEHNLERILEQSQHSSEAKPNRKWSWSYFTVLTKPLLCLEFNKHNEQNVYEFILKIYIFRLKLIVDTDWCQKWNITTPRLKISYKINTQACFLMQRFQSFSGHSSKQSISHYLLASNVDHNCKFSMRNFQLLQYSSQLPGFGMLGFKCYADCRATCLGLVACCY